MDGELTEARKVGTSGVITDFTGKNRAVTPPVTTLEVLLEGVDLAERVVWMDIKAETGVREGPSIQPPPPPPPPRRTQAAGRQTEKLGRR